MFINNRRYAIMRMVLLAILILGNLGVHPVYATTIDFGWAQSMGGPFYDSGSAIAVDGNGNVYTTGGYDSSSENDDIFINKLDGNGSIIWSKIIGGTASDGGTSIAVDADGSVYTLGAFISSVVDFDPGVGINNLINVGSVDIFISKLDKNGNFLWARSIGGPSGEYYGAAVAVDDGGNIYITGRYSDTLDFDPGVGISNLTSAGSIDIFISKLDSNGNFIWAKSMGGTSNDESFDIAVDGMGSIVTTGYFYGTADFDPGAGTSNLISAGGQNLFISKLDSNGNFVWAKSAEGTGGINGMGIALDSSGNVYTTGAFINTVYFNLGATSLTSVGSGDIFISKLDVNGNFVWAKSLGGTSDDLGYDIDVDGNGDVYATGEFRETVSFDPVTGISSLISAGYNDTFISKLDTNGNFVWAKSLGGESYEISWGISADSRGIYLTGEYSGTADFDPYAGTNNLTSAGGNDVFIVKLATVPQIYYVKQDTTGANNGSSWMDAYKDLQSALSAASSGDEIWVAAGTYKPTSGTDRDISFTLKNGVAIYGGFVGTETLLSQRNYETNVTVLSGDVGVAEDKSDNSYHVVVGSNTNNSAVLDGFTITDGNANGTEMATVGGGMYTLTGSPTINNITFANNAATIGGGMYNENKSNPTLTNVTFNGNTTTAFGGGMSNMDSKPILTDVIFINNSAQKGGGMNNVYSNPTLTNVTFHKNELTDVYGTGGGMDNFYSNLILTNVTFSENSPAFWGGGMYNNGSNPILTDVTFYKNAATYSGGGMSNRGSNPILKNVTFDNNSAPQGGGMKNTYNSNPTLTNVTFSDNLAANYGGGMSNENNSNTTLTHVTFNGNTAATYGGGVYNDSFSNVTIRNSILYGDFGGEIHNIAGTATVTHSIVQGGYPGVGNIDKNPLLGPLQDNGGFTKTMALGAGSPAIDAGNDINCPSADQRGVTRPHGSHCDIGAYEASVITVTKTDDTNDGVCDTDCSLREAIQAASAGDTILFAPSLAGGTITLTTQLTLNKDLSIDGSGLSPQLVLNGGNATRIMEIIINAEMTISDLVFTNGFATEGGAIHAIANSRLTLNNSTFYQNQASLSGGAISMEGNSVGTFINTTFNQNQAGASGGAIFMEGNSVGTIVNSTVFENRAEVGGGAISIAGSADIQVFNSTFAANSAPEGSEANALGLADLALYNTILACVPGNSGCIYQAFTASVVGSNSIIETGILASFGLADLADNGGPTQTMALLPGSPLIDAGDDSICGNSYVNHLDQRGMTRPQGSHCDIGAYEAPPDTIPPTVASIVRASANPTGAVTVNFTVTFSEPVTGVTASGFSLHTTGNITGATIVGATGSGTTYTVTVNTGTKNGTLRLDVPASAMITDLVGNALSSLSFETGEAYTIARNSGADTTGVFRPSNGALYLKNKNETGFADVQINYGLGGDYPVVGDWDGNGTVTIGIYRNGSFYLRNENTIGFADIVFPFGMPGDQPVAGDWDGDGVDTIGVYRNGTFYLRNSNDAGAPEMSFALGVPGDVGIAGDWNADGIDTTGVFRPNNGALYLKNINETGYADIQINYGLPGDKPVTGDWDGDGDDTIGIYREGAFYLRNTNTIGYADWVFGLGVPGDHPIAGNWDGVP